MKNVLIKLTTFSGVVLLCGCSSVMSHTGGKEGTYPGTRASAAMLSDDDTNWDDSVRSRVEKSEQENLATNAVIPPAEMPPR